MHGESVRPTSDQTPLPMALCGSTAAARAWLSELIPASSAQLAFWLHLAGGRLARGCWSVCRSAMPTPGSFCTPSCDPIPAALNRRSSHPEPARHSEAEGRRLITRFSEDTSSSLDLPIPTTPGRSRRITSANTALGDGRRHLDTSRSWIVIRPTMCRKERARSRDT